MNRISELRKMRKLSQADLANKLGIAQNTLSQYETEYRALPSKFVLCLSDFFGVSPHYLLGKEEINMERLTARKNGTAYLAKIKMVRKLNARSMPLNVF